jgi:hypothetical protein
LEAVSYILRSHIGYLHSAFMVKHVMPINAQWLYSGPCAVTYCPCLLCSPVGELAGVSCEKQAGPDGRTCSGQKCFGWLKCDNGCVVDGVDWEGSPCFYNGEPIAWHACYALVMSMSFQYNDG